MDKDAKVIAARNFCLFLCLIAVLLSAVCVRYFILRYAAARQKRLFLQERSLILRSLLSVQEKSPGDLRPAGVDHRAMPWDSDNIQSYAMAAAGEINRLADGCGVKVVSMRASAPERRAETVNLETETTGGEKEILAFISAVENSLFIFTINKARIDVLPGGGDQLKAGFSFSALKNIPGAAQEKLKGGELFSETVSMLRSNVYPGEGKSLFFDGHGRVSDRAQTAADERFQSVNGDQSGLPGIKLTGIILGREPVAFVEDCAAGKNYRLYPGQYINGFRLERVMKGKAFLLKGERVYELSL